MFPTRPRPLKSHSGTAGYADEGLENSLGVECEHRKGGVDHILGRNTIISTDIYISMYTYSYFQTHHSHPLASFQRSMIL